MNVIPEMNVTYETNVKPATTNGNGFTIYLLSLLIICLCCSSSSYFSSSNTNSNIKNGDTTKYFIIAQPLQPIQLA